MVGCVAGKFASVYVRWMVRRKREIEQARERKQRTRGVPLLQENEVMKANRRLASSSSADEAVIKWNRRSGSNHRDDKDGKLYSSRTKTHTKPE